MNDHIKQQTDIIYAWIELAINLCLTRNRPFTEEEAESNKKVIQSCLETTYAKGKLDQTYEHFQKLEL